MGKGNDRGAGRKPALSEEEIAQIQKRHQAGETITALAREHGVSRQTLSGYLNREDGMEEKVYRTLRKWAQYNHQFRHINVADYTMRMDYMCQEECCTVILVNFREKKIAIENRTENMLHRAFGMKAKPDWNDFEAFLEERCFPRSRDGIQVILRELGLDFYDPLAIVEKTKGRMAEDFQWIEISYFSDTSC